MAIDELFLGLRNAEQLPVFRVSVGKQADAHDRKQSDYGKGTLHANASGMIDFEIPYGSPIGSGHNRVKFRRGRLAVDVPIECFQTSFCSFTNAAELFARRLSDVLHQKFAYRYLSYLQEIARGAESTKPYSINGRPACRLITNELDRLFRSHFCKPNEGSLTSAA
jgi:hypothetical protein